MASSPHNQEISSRKSRRCVQGGAIPFLLITSIPNTHIIISTIIVQLIIDFINNLKFNHNTLISSSILLGPQSCDIK